MSQYSWPDPATRPLLGKKITRVDGPSKSSGRAKYTSDYNPQGLLAGKILRSPYAHAKIVSIDTSAAEKMPGVKAVEIIQGPGVEIFWAGDEIVGVAAVDEGTAEDALRAIKVEYQVLPHFVSDAEPPKNVATDSGPISSEDFDDMQENQVPDDEVIAAIQKRGISFKPTEKDFASMKGMGVEAPVIAALRKAKYVESTGKAKSPYKKTALQTQGEPDKAFASAGAVSEGIYGTPCIVHSCLETHGSAIEWPGEKEVVVHVSTQNVSGIVAQLAEPLSVPAGNINVLQRNVGGGFGSKFSVDRWDVNTGKLSQKAGGKPVKNMLDRRAEFEVAGMRPSAYARVKIAADKDGKIVAWESRSWGTGGVGGGGTPPLPYIFEIPNQRKQNTAISTNQGSARAWRAPNHPQAAAITMGAIEDLAAKLKMDPLDLVLKNLDIAGPRKDTYKEEFAIADDLMGWKTRWHQRGDTTPGDIKQGLGLSMHTWGGRGHNSAQDFTINPDGSVLIKLGTQDLGTGALTIITIVAADTLGVAMDNVKVMYGNNRYPQSGGSGGSTTSGGVTSSTRRGAINARDALFEKVAPALKAKPEELEAVNGRVQVKGDTSRGLAWKEACAKIGAVPLTVQGKNPDKSEPPDLTNSGVGGVQMADVSVDIETGIVRINKMVAVQDCGLVVDVMTAESQVYGALIMGISYALYEEKILDPISGQVLNPNLEFYRLAGLNDIGELKVHMMTGKGYDERGVIGLAEPPVVSPGAAISNAVANAIGVRVPFLPLTPQNVLEALEQGGAHATV
ncbi:MAG TPA: xanthine dehydrogenase family protein molybdopterin-binding subunit [Candidatus Angelobacter sp.]|nr:xanthine dehydrogenase family protein molybdopterin-binding subunit [Candidatus Angelobacter sp.]